MKPTSAGHNPHVVFLGLYGSSWSCLLARVYGNVLTMGQYHSHTLSYQSPMNGGINASNGEWCLCLGCGVPVAEIH